MTLTTTFYHFYVKRTILNSYSWVRHRPFTRAFSMTIPFTKESKCHLNLTRILLFEYLNIYISCNREINIKYII